MGAAALPASAQSYQDTALIGGSVSTTAFAGSGLGASNSDNHADINLSGSGVTWTLHSAASAVSLSGTTISYSGAATTSTSSVTVDATDKNGNAEALVFPVSLGNGTIQTAGTVSRVTVTGLSDSNVSGTVKFSASSSDANASVSFAETNLPTGLSSGSPTLTYVGGTAAPGNYTGVAVTATDSDGAAQTGTFTLTVDANSVSEYGDEVNRFGNGFDSFRQHDYAGAIIAGWTATQSDPATHFILNNGTHAGALQFEYAPNGSASGLCVSDPGGGWSSDPLRDGLILANCNTGPWQQFLPQSDGSLKNLETGLYVNPNGTGAQLRGGSSPTSWGGSSYRWTDNSSLPS